LLPFNKSFSEFPRRRFSVEGIGMRTESMRMPAVLILAVLQFTAMQRKLVFGYNS
jgi:hypothetical protein